VAIKTMRDLLIEEMREMHDAEKQAVRAYPKLARKLQTESLKTAVEEHLEETKSQIERLEQLFEQMESRPRGKRCEAMRGLIEDAQELLDLGLEDEMLEVVLIPALQKMEHFEIAAYGSARAHLAALGLDEAVKVVEESLEEEKAMDERLTRIAAEEVNPRAVEMAAEEEREEGGEEEERESVDRAAAGDKPKSSSKPRRK
jgi:ferritin-like metal-binding protein YciE